MLRHSSSSEKEKKDKVLEALQKGEKKILYFLLLHFAMQTCICFVLEMKPAALFLVLWKHFYFWRPFFVTSVKDIINHMVG